MYACHFIYMKNKVFEKKCEKISTEITTHHIAAVTKQHLYKQKSQKFVTKLHLYGVILCTESDGVLHVLKTICVY